MKGTVFYRRRTPEAEIIDPLTLIREDSRISSLARVKGHQEETIIDWIRTVDQHAAPVEELLLVEHRIKGHKKEVLALLGKSIAYVERTYLTIRRFNRRLTRKTLGFSKKLEMY